MSRSRVLQSLFSLLYGPLAPLHEFTGLLAFGGAWSGRRRALLSYVTEREGLILDLGCGEGRLLLEATKRGRHAVGIEPSPAMVRRAMLRGVTVVRAEAGHLPIQTGSVAAVLVSYPGPWILASETWREIERVARPAGQIVILLGGTIERGRLATVRRLVGSLVYGGGSDPSGVASLPRLGDGAIVGSWSTVPDAWGTAFVWQGRRKGYSGP